ncbi:MAG: TonB-dependent receptor [Telluria sp.]
MFRKTVLVRALSIAFSTAALSAAVMSPAMAQNVTGNIYGKVAPGSATEVVLKNTETNATRTVRVDADGNFNAGNLSLGHYKVTLMKGGVAGATSDVDTVAGQGVEAVFSSGAVQTVQVSGRRSRIDVSNATNGATFSSRELTTLPVARNVAAIIQLAPNTTRADPSYGAGASIGGGAASENAYYINGFPVTNPLTQMGASELPFGAIAQAEVKTGGFGAEFGRSVGGVVNIIGKSGTNTWEAGALLAKSPKSWRAKERDIYWSPNANSANKGKLRWQNSDDYFGQTQVGGYVGGPIIQDKVFMFASVEETDSDSGVVNQIAQATTAALGSSGYRKRQTKSLRYYTKFDWNINDNHRLELTTFVDQPTVDTKYYSYNYATHAIGDTVKSAIHERNDDPAGIGNNTGGDYQFLHYAGTLTDDLNVSALYGVSRTRHIYEPAGYDANLPGVTADTNNRAPGLNYSNTQTFGNVAFSGALDKFTFKRLDLEYKLGSHLIRFGGDNSKTESLHAGSGTAGGYSWIYQRTTAPTQPQSVPGGTVPAVAGHGPLSDQGYYVLKNVFSTVSNAYAGQDAQYIEDQWKVTKNLLITLGLRNEGFYNANSDQVKYLEMKNQREPRFAAVWDVNGDSSFKVYGSAGRYAVQIPTRVTLRAANGSLNTSQYYTYTGTDGQGLPTGLTQLTAPLSANGEFGQAKDPRTVAALGMKPSAQDELSLGFDKVWSPELTFGGKVTYRKLQTTIDDLCDGRPFRRYALAHHIATIDDATFDPENPVYSYFNCAAFNPGEGNSFMIDYMQNGQYTKVTLSAADLGFPKAERKYTAVDLYLEHPLRNGWYGKINYTWSRSKGNTEGQTLSDLNNAQNDLSATTTWDYPEIMNYANGLLANDRTHQIKAFGYWNATEQWTIGANVNIESGRPRGCVGGNPDPNAGADWQQVGTSPNYGVEHYCFGVASGTKTSVDNNVPAPRGTMGRLPWRKALDLNVAYKPTFLAGLQLKAEVFNVFNSQVIAKYNEQYNSGTAIASTYGTVSAYTGPRSARVSAEYNHKF